jgi:hypothetical protein
MPIPVEERFWAKVNKDGPIPAHRPELGSCWLWTAATDRKGYGVFRLAGKLIKAHRVAYELIIGPFPAGLLPDHCCRNHGCVNPAHLEPVTNRENMRRGIKGALTTHCPAGHAYDAANTYRDPRGRRHCRLCERNRRRAREARQR